MLLLVSIEILILWFQPIIAMLAIHHRISTLYAYYLILSMIILKACLTYFNIKLGGKKEYHLDSFKTIVILSFLQSLNIYLLS
jgi:hypothetical protein